MKGKICTVVTFNDTNIVARVSGIRQSGRLITADNIQNSSNKVKGLKFPGGNTSWKVLAVCANCDVSDEVYKEMDRHYTKVRLNGSNLCNIPLDVYNDKFEPIEQCSDACLFFGHCQLDWEVMSDY